MDIKELKLAVPGAKRHPWELAKCKVVQFLLNKYKKDAEFTHSTILDIGCGDLFVLRRLSELYKDMKLFGVDTALERDIIDFSFSRMPDSNIFLSLSLDEIDQYIHRTVDFVFLLDVIEHIENDIDYLKGILAHRFISYETYFIITAPAFQCLTCSHDRYLGHYRRYTNRNLKKSVESAGLQIVDIGYFFFTLLIPRILQKIYELMQNNHLKEQYGVSHWNYNKSITKIVMNILYYDFRMGYLLNKHARLNVPGLSNFVICRKKRAS